MTQEVEAKVSLFKRKISLPISLASIITVTGIGGVQVIKEFDAAQVNREYAAERDLVEFESLKLGTNTRPVELNMQALARQQTGDPNLELYCVIPDRSRPKRMGFYQPERNGENSYILIHPLLCNPMQFVSDPSFNAANDDPTGIIQQAAIIGTRVLAHEFGHAVNRTTSEDEANRYADDEYMVVGKALGMPSAVINSKAENQSYID